MATTVAALDVPPKPTQWVNDYGAHALTADQTQQLNQKLEDLYKRTGAQFLIMIFPSLQGDEVLEYTNRVANQWKVKEDKALMIFVFINDRKTWIQVGYGLEPVITDAYASRVYRNTLIPYFQKGQYAAGLNAAVDELASKVEGSSGLPATGTTTGTTSSSTTRGQRGAPQPNQRLSGTDLIFIAIIFLVFLFVILPLLRRGGCGGCSGCFLPLFLGGGGGTTFGGGGFGGGGGGGGGWSTGGSWGGGDSSFGGGGAGGSW